ncbi:hypothetical protein [Aestuariibacter sp. A3R04]|uniref:hypothetical protein n=1 Tax=Aestuariibacter sp. A3R04 TaxID=2841571 RepID=UPI00209038A4|nr:hypothetical protein [Aestuariibacter sp. A3R04]
MEHQASGNKLTSSRKSVFSFLKTRIFAAVIMVMITSTVMIPGMSTYLPFNQNDAVGLPILLFPFIWAALFIYCFLVTSVKQLWAVLVSLAAIHIICIYFALAG